MLHLELNLARRQAENRRRTWLTWGAVTAAFLVLLCGLLARLSVEYITTRKVQHAVSQERRQMAPLRQQAHALDVWLSRPEVRGELHRVHDLNRLIQEKAVSWTLLFQRLEQIMPGPVQLQALRPARQSHYTAVVLTVASPRVGPLVRLVRRLEQDNEFSHPVVLQQRRHRGQNADSADGGSSSGSGPIQLEILARYTPHLPRLPKTPAAAHTPVNPARAGRGGQ